VPSIDEYTTTSGRHDSAADTVRSTDELQPLLGVDVRAVVELLGLLAGRLLEHRADVDTRRGVHDVQAGVRGLLAARGRHQHLVAGGTQRVC
jgi:hypothetical protein